MTDDNENKNDSSKPRSSIDHRINHINRQEEASKHWADLQKQWIADLTSNPKYKFFFEQFSSHSIDGFITHYVANKQLWLKHGEFYKSQVEKKALEFKDEAYQCLWEIQQKKLFNLQCQWRAELIQLEGLQLTAEFTYWEFNIEQCDFIPAITPDEVELYKQYLFSTDYSKLGWFNSWQDYHGYKREYQKGDDGSINLPEWYMFYDNRKGTGSLMLLPDIRGEKEYFYSSIYWKKRQVEIEKDVQQNPHKYPKPDNRPSLNYYSNDKIIIDFIKQFDDKKVLEYYLAYKEVTKTVFDDDDELAFIFEKIKDVNEFIPIEAHHNWREALSNAWNNYRKNNIAVALPIAYDEYCFRKKMKIAHPTKKDNKDEWYKDHFDNWRNAIVNGRLLNGEPGDLNF